MLTLHNYIFYISLIYFHIMFAFAYLYGVAEAEAEAAEAAKAEARRGGGSRGGASTGGRLGRASIRNELVSKNRVGTQLCLQLEMSFV